MWLGTSRRESLLRQCPLAEAAALLRYLTQERHQSGYDDECPHDGAERIRVSHDPPADAFCGADDFQFRMLYRALGRIVPAVAECACPLLA